MKPTKLPQDWKPSDFDVRYAKERGFTDSEIDDIAESFATYWTLGMGRNKTHLCWSGSGRSAWGTWVRSTTLKNKTETESYTNGVDPEELKQAKGRDRLTKIISRRKLELQHSYEILTPAEREEADRYLGLRTSEG